MIFEPTLRDQYPDEYKEFYTETLKKITPGAVLYKVLAVKHPRLPKVHIGNLVTKSCFVESDFGDRYLFFKH